MEVPLGFRANILVADTVILEIKAVPALLPAHEAHLQTSLRMSRLPVGRLLNFHATRLEDGLKRFVGSRSTYSPRPLRPSPASVLKLKQARTHSPVPKRARRSMRQLASPIEVRCHGAAASWLTNDAATARPGP
jgi:hypothetical protein